MPRNLGLNKAPFFVLGTYIRNLRLQKGKRAHGETKCQASSGSSLQSTAVLVEPALGPFQDVTTSQLLGIYTEDNTI